MPHDLASVWKQFVDQLKADIERDSRAADAGKATARPIVSAFVFFKEGDEGYALTGDTARMYEKVSRTLSKEASAAATVTPQAVRDWLQPVVAHLIRDLQRDEARSDTDYLRELRNSVGKQRTRWTVLVQTYGIALEEDAILSLGPVRLVALQSTTVDGIRQQIQRVLDDKKKLTPKAAQHAAETLAAPLVPQAYGETGAAAVAEVDSADSKRACELAVEHTITLLKTFRAFIFGQQRALIQTPVGIGRRVTALRKVSALSEGGDLYGQSMWAEPFGFPFKVSQKLVEHWRETGWARLDSAWQSSAKKGGWERQLAEAVCWLGDALAEPRRHIAVLHCVTALEMLLVARKERERITTALAERVAFLVARDSLDSRRAFYESAKSIYDLRSRIVHDGKTEVSNEELKASLWVAWDVIANLLRRSDIGSAEDIERYCLEQKLSPSVDGWSCPLPG